MMDVTVKTLDSQTRQFCVPEQITVKEFKERIAGSVNIPAATQRLIFCGRVLQDSKKLSEYDVHGRTIHLVEKPPPSTTTAASSTSTSTTSGQQAGSGTTEGRDSFFMGAITVQADDAGSIHVQPNGSHMDVHINLGPINVAPPVSASQQRVNQIRNLLRQVNVTLDRLENPMQQQGTQTEPDTSSSSGTPASTGTSTSSTTTATQTNQQSDTTGGTSPSQESQARDNQSTTGQPGSRTHTVVHPRGTVMADILTEMDRVTSRLQPYLDQYRELLSGDQVFEGDRDRQPAHRLQTLVNQALHYISHIYHAMSDCMMDLHTTPPRVLRAPAGMMVAPIRPPGQMPVQVNMGQTTQEPAPSSAPSAPTQERAQTPQTAQGDSTQSTTTQSTSTQSASTRTSATGTTQTPSTQPLPDLTSASVTLTNQQTYVITPRQGGGASAPQTTAPAGSGRPGTTGNQSGTASRPTGRHVHIRQVGLNPGSIPPAGLLQVMAQMVGQQQMQQMAQFPANHAGPTNTSSTPTTSSPRPQQNPQSTPSPQNQNQARQPPPMAFFNPLQPRPAWDPLLPCNSRHITMRVMPVGPTGRGRAGAGTQNTGTETQTSGEAAGRNPGENVRAEPSQNDAVPQPMAADGSLSDMIGGLVGALLNQQQHPFVQVVPPGAQQPTQQAFATSTQHQRATQAPMFSGTSSSAPRGGSQPGGRGGEEVTDQMLISMILRMSQEIGGVGSGQRSSQSLRQFLAGMGMSLEPGEGFIGEVFDLVTQQLGMGDLAALFLGQPGPFNHLRPTLQQFVNNRIMRGETMTTENIQVAVQRIMDELQPSVAEFIGGAPTVLNIDPVATHMKFLSSILERFVRLFVPPTNPSAFGEQMRTLGHDGLHQWVALMLYIFGDRQNVDRYLSERLRTWFGGSDSTPSNLVASMSMQNFDLAHRMLTVTPEQIMHFVVKKRSSSDTDRDDAEPSPTPATSGSPMETDQRADQSEDSLDSDQVIIEAQILVEEQPVDALGAPERAQLEAVAQTDRGRLEVTAPASGEAAVTPVPPTTSADEGAVAMETNSWEAAVPAEWVPVINQDIARQRRQAPQGGLSDAYLAGMPPKRMKLTQDRKAPINNGVETFIPDTLRRAVQAVGAQPLSSVESLVQDTEETPSLHEACEEQIRSAIQERLRRDPDYDPQRFPNTDKYIHKKN